jgi:hypothetical protein
MSQMMHNTHAQGILPKSLRLVRSLRDILLISSAFGWRSAEQLSFHLDCKILKFTLTRL